MKYLCARLLVPSVSSFVSIDGIRIVRGDGSQYVRKQGCCLYAFVQIDVDLSNIAEVLLDLDVYILAACRSSSLHSDKNQSPL